MTKINWMARVKNPIFWVQVMGTILLTALTYNSLQPADLTSWQGVGRSCFGESSPILILLVSCLWGVWNAVNDPTTAGLKDSQAALTYTAPKKGQRKGGIFQWLNFNSLTFLSIIPSPIF